MPLITGSRLGSYEILNLLGVGGRGSALELAERLSATANSYENAPVVRFPRRSACGHAEGICVSSRRGWGRAASEKQLTPSPCR